MVTNPRRRRKIGYITDVNFSPLALSYSRVHKSDIITYKRFESIMLVYHVIMTWIDLLTEGKVESFTRD